MRGATDCTKRLKKLLASLRTRLGRVNRPAVGDPITQLTLGVFTRDAVETKAREVLDIVHGMVVDYNELRVIPPMELARTIGEYPGVREKCEDLSRALNRIFAIEHAVSLERFRNASARDTQVYLERIDGLEPYTRARIRLLGLGQHAIPLDEAMWAYARREEIVDPKCPLDEAQQFLERQVSADDALEFVALMRKQAWTEMAGAVRKGDAEKILSIPPDRTSSNMLQLLASGGTVGAAVDDELELDAELGLDAAELGEPALPREKGKSPKPAAKSKSGQAKPTATIDKKKPIAAAKSAPAKSRAVAPADNAEKSQKSRRRSSAKTA